MHRKPDIRPLPLPGGRDPQAENYWLKGSFLWQMSKDSMFVWNGSQSYSCIRDPVTMEKTEEDFRNHLFPGTARELLCHSPWWL